VILAPTGIWWRDGDHPWGLRLCCGCRQALDRLAWLGRPGIREVSQGLGFACPALRLGNGSARQGPSLVGRLLARWWAEFEIWPQGKLGLAFGGRPGSFSDGFAGRRVGDRKKRIKKQKKKKTTTNKKREGESRGDGFPGSPPVTKKNFKNPWCGTPIYWFRRFQR